jgi:superfamily II DNA or RNA helicase
LGGSESEQTAIFLPLEEEPPRSATFPLPSPDRSGTQAAGLLLRDALRLKLRAGAGPFRSLGNIAVEPRAYQLVPLLMALKQSVVRLLVADEVGVGKTIEACLIARELLDRGEIERMSVICPPHLCDQWQRELKTKFAIDAVVVRTGTARRLDRGLPAGMSIFEEYPFTVVSLDFIKSERRRDEFLRACPHFVIVEEAHTCVQGSGRGKHQRYELLRGLAAKGDRHMVFLTATPHSGDEEAFHNLLGLLDEKFKQLQGMPDVPERRRLREELALYLVQRRRPDIAEWKDSTVFPDRQSAEATYSLTGAWGRLFEDVLDYARRLVRAVEQESRLVQRMNWWAALALLRCISSSPAAAAIALRTRLQAIEGETEAEQLAQLEGIGAETVLDGLSDDELTADESVPAAVTERVEEDRELLTALIQAAEELKGAKNDPKLKLLIGEVKKLLAAGFRPVIFCRYIATAHYVAAELKQAFKRESVHVEAITGELPPEDREVRVEDFAHLAGDTVPILVATDCLSEGINLQQCFNAVVHYDLTWNPTRHEQREGRVDRFGQSAATVRALMLYGQNNPVDGAVLKVILQKAARIRQELGVGVPMPRDNNAMMETIMQAVLLQSERKGASSAIQLTLALEGLEQIEQDLERDWESAKETAKRSQTVFAQRRLRPEEVLPEWHKALAILGGAKDVERLVKAAAERLGAPLEPVKSHYRFPTAYLPTALKERLLAVGVRDTVKLAFQPPFDAGVEVVHRAHPLVIEMADYIAERSLAEEDPQLAARCGVIRTQAVQKRTAVYLLRLRSQIAVELYREGKYVPHQEILTEECVAATLNEAGEFLVLEDGQALALMGAEPSGNLDSTMRSQQIQRCLDELPQRAGALNAIARQRAEGVLEDHRRVRTASVGRGESLGARYGVQPCLPVDVIGIYILLPTPKL